MAGRPKRRERLAREAGKAFGPGSGSGGTGGAGGRQIVLSPEVQTWVRTGRGFTSGEGFTEGGTPARNAEDLARAIAAHIRDEKANPEWVKRHGMESKYETRDYTIEEFGERNPFWLWLNTGTGRGTTPKGAISVVVDHG